MPLVVIPDPAEESRHYATRTRQTHDAALRQQTKHEAEDVDDVSDIDDSLHYNICGLFCCFPIAFIGIIFSLLCKSAKAAGKREEAKWMSAIASTFFSFSIAGGLWIIIIILNPNSNWLN